MRTRSSIINLCVAWGGQIISLLVQMITRVVFVRYLSNEYLGLSALFSNVLTIFSFVELGIGPAMTYSLYKPLAENNIEKIKSLMKLYQNTYRVIGVLMLAMAIITIPLYPTLIGEMPNIPNLDLIYFIFVFNAAISYFYTYKRSLICCDQKKYIETIVHYAVYISYNVAQIVVLSFTKNYILFLVCQVMGTIFTNIILSIIADKRYPYLKDKNVKKLDSDSLKDIKKNIKALIFHKIGTVVVNGTDNILISKFVSLSVTGVYSNYLLIINATNTIFAHIFNSITASVGNLAALETKGKINDVFEKIFFVNFWIYGFCAVSMFSLVQPFISVWLGDDYLLGYNVVFFIVLNFYLYGMRNSVLTFRNATGTYYYDRYKPLFESMVNLIVSLVLVQKIGLVGVFVGTTCSYVFVCVWMELYVVCKYVLGVSFFKYALKYIMYLTATFFAGIVVFCLCSLEIFNFEFLPAVIVCRFLICTLVTNCSFYFVFHKTKVYESTYLLVKTICVKFSKNLKGKLK